MVVPHQNSFHHLPLEKAGDLLFSAHRGFLQQITVKNADDRGEICRGKVERSLPYFFHHVPVEKA